MHLPQRVDIIHQIEGCHARSMAILSLILTRPIHSWVAIATVNQLQESGCLMKKEELLLHAISNLQIMELRIFIRTLTNIL